MYKDSYSVPSKSSHARRITHREMVHRLRPEQNAISLRQARVTIAEDDEDMRLLLAGALRRAGYAVVEVADGNELLDRMASGILGSKQIQPDLIVSDIRMPGWSGFDVLAGLRRSGWAIPVILITAFGDDKTHAKAKRLGAVTLLDKPFDVDELPRVVRAVVPARV